MNTNLEDLELKNKNGIVHPQGNNVTSPTFSSLEGVSILKDKKNERYNIIAPTTIVNNTDISYNVNRSFVLKNSLISQNLEYKIFCDRIGEEFKKMYPKGRNRDKAVDHLKNVLLHLIIGIPTKSYLSISRDRNRYLTKVEMKEKNELQKQNKYATFHLKITENDGSITIINKINSYIGFETSMNVMEFLKVNNYITYVKGSKMTGKMTMIAPTELLIDKIKNNDVDIKKVYSTVKYDYNIEELILLSEKDENDIRRLVSYTNNDITVYSRNLLIKYNELLRNSKIEYIEKSVPPLPSFPVLLLHNTEVKRKGLEFNTLYRIFCYGSLEFGGRFYAKSMGGKTWQGLNAKEERTTITIEGNETVELDYPHHHSSILMDEDCTRYIKWGEDDFNKGSIIRQDDIYRVKIDGELVPKPLVKDIMNLVYNTESYEQHYQVIQGRVNCGDIDLSNYDKKWKSNIKKTIQSVFEHNYHLKHHFCNNEGIRLQRIDSDITQIILEYFTNRNILCLPVHDSYIVPKKYTNELKEIMKQAYEKVVKGIELKIML